jgi:hypothetical protein
VGGGLSCDVFLSLWAVALSLWCRVGWCVDVGWYVLECERVLKGCWRGLLSDNRKRAKSEFIVVQLACECVKV